jgi:hypothetical protein
MVSMYHIHRCGKIYQGKMPQKLNYAPFKYCPKKIKYALGSKK